MEQKDRPKVGVAAIVIKDGKVLFHKRKGAHGEGTWSFPGGHLEFGESVEECAIRETLEEAGIHITNLRHATFTNDVFEKEGKHYITLYVVADHLSGVPRTMEPAKSEGWAWFDWDHPPSPVFLPIENLYKSGFRPK
jgi:8-oxo-dGTP diphosphatase